MKYKVKYSKAAVRDLDRVWSEVFEVSKSLDITISYIEELMGKVEAKNMFPESGTPLYYEDSFTGYYYVVFKAYMAFYRIDDDSVLVDRIMSGKSDYMRRLGMGISE